MKRSFLSLSFLAFGLLSCNTVFPENKHLDPFSPLRSLSNDSNVIPKNYRVSIVLIDVTCNQQEDLTGADDFYAGMAAVLIPANGEKMKAEANLISPPIAISSGETKILKHVVFEEVVPAESSLSARVIAYEEDMAHDWEKVADRFLDAANGTTRRMREEVERKRNEEKLLHSDAKVAALAAAKFMSLDIVERMLDAGAKIFDIGARLDKDDVLGNVGIGGPDGLPPIVIHEGDNYEIKEKLKFSGYRSIFSKWDYDISYRLKVEPTTAQVTIKPKSEGADK